MFLIIALIVALLIVNLFIVRLMARRNRDFASQIHTTCSG